MQTRKFDELISYFNRKVADMDIDINYKMELLGMVTALGCAHEKEQNNPTIEPQQEPKWVPVSERLPELDVYVIATTQWYEITMACRIGDGEWFIHEDNANAYDDDILAWMPLPEPYRP